MNVDKRLLEKARIVEDRAWMWRDAEHVPHWSFTKPDAAVKSLEYMRVLSRQEVDKIAGEGVDVQQYINSLLRTIEGQRKHIANLEKTVERYSEAMEDDGNV